MAVEHEGGPVATEPLACGRDAVRVWEHAEADGLDEHERTCPHCRSTVADRERLAGLVDRMAAQQMQPPPNVVEQVVAAAAGDLRPHDLLELGDGAWLARPAAAAALRHVVDSMDGLRARSCRITQDPGAARGEPGALHVTVGVTARFGVDLASVTARVRQMMISTGDRAFGVAVARVDIQVVDVWDEEGS